MRHSITFVLLSLFIFFSASAQSLEEAMPICIKNLECKLGIYFDNAWKPIIRYEIPNGMPVEEAQNFEACYYPAEQVFFFHPRYEGIVFPSGTFFADSLFLPFDTSLSAQIRMATYHELGHAYADQVSRSMGLGMWPKEEWFAGDSVKKELLIDMLSEGVAEYFGRAFLRDRSETEIMPEEWEVEFTPLQYEHLSYEGGYWLVRPILDACASEGVRYIVSHPIDFFGQSIKNSVFLYWENAFKTLRKK